MSGWGSFLAGIASTVTKRAMVGIGMGIASYAGLSAALNAALGAAKAAWAGLGGEALAFLQMAGAVTFVSVVAGGMVAAVSVTALKKFEVR